ncbi:MAG TPA: hypothetical protein VFX47_04415 [Gammaproteobacteria bacterium]|nr:hypothetical protein [Gammaproteobacteria bacterium]
MLRHTLKLLAGILFAALCTAAIAADSPFLGSRSEAHATLYLNVDQTAKQIYPVAIWAVDGKLTNRSDQGVLWIKPGEYTFKVKVARGVNLANVPGLQHSSRYGQQEHELKLVVEAGKGYYIGAKFEASGKWQPEVWKTEDTKY